MPATRPDTAARWFVRGVTVACCVAVGWLVVKQGTAALPVQDEWEMLGKQVDADFGRWAFEHHNEHRYPLGRAAWACLLRAGGFDFRVPMFVSVGLLTASAVLLQWAARRLRGWTHPVDALSAVLLLHFGHAFNLYMGYQVVFTLFAYGVAGWVWCGVNWGATKRTGWAWGGAAYAVSLLFGGGFGLVFTPVVAAWLGYVGVTLARDRRWLSAVLFGLLAVGAVAYSGWVVATLPPSNTERLHPVKQADRWLVASAEYLSGAVGNWGVELEGGWLRGITTVTVLVAVAVAVAVAGWWVVRRSLGRRAVGVVLLAAVAGCVGSALAVGLARPTMALGDRFTTPSAVGLAVAVVTLTAGVRTRRWGSLAAAGLVVGLAVAVGSLTYTNAKRLGQMYRSSLEPLHADLLSGTPPTVLAGRHGGGFGVLVGDYLLDCLPRFKRAGVGVFTRMADDPPHTPVPVDALSPTRPFTLTLPPPPPGAFAVRLRMSAGPISGGHPLTAGWTAPDGRPTESTARTHFLGWPSHVVLTFDGGPDGLTISGVPPEPRVEAIDWLVVTP
jgi:hypothetical protein